MIKIGQGHEPCNEINTEFTSSSFTVGNGVLFYLMKKDYQKCLEMRVFADATVLPGGPH